MAILHTGSGMEVLGRLGTPDQFIALKKVADRDRGVKKNGSCAH